MTRMEQFDQVCSENEQEDVVEYSGESAIEWLRGDKIVTATFPSSTKECHRIKKYAKEYPDEVKISRQNQDGSIVARFPKKYLRITRPATRELTEEQCAAIVELLAKARKARQEREANILSDSKKNAPAKTKN